MKSNSKFHILLSLWLFAIICFNYSFVVGDVQTDVSKSPSSHTDENTMTTDSHQKIKKSKKDTKEGTSSQDSIINTLKEMIDSGDLSQLFQQANINLPNPEPLLKIAKSMMDHPSVSDRVEKLLENIKGNKHDLDNGNSILNDHENDDVDGDDVNSPFLRFQQQYCTFSCPNNPQMVPKPKTNWTPRANGCGITGLQLSPQEMIYDFTACCNQHDICYDTCGNDKKQCDKSFLRCMKSLCQTQYPQNSNEKRNNNINNDNGPSNEETDDWQRIMLNPTCLQNANVFYQATKTLGCRPYKQSQSEACTCEESNSIDQQNHQDQDQTSNDHTDIYTREDL